MWGCWTHPSTPTLSLSLSLSIYIIHSFWWMSKRRRRIERNGVLVAMCPTSLVYQDKGLRSCRKDVYEYKGLRRYRKDVCQEKGLRRCRTHAPLKRCGNDAAVGLATVTP
jgi:hypothetical protein